MHVAYSASSYVPKVITACALDNTRRRFHGHLPDSIARVPPRYCLHAHGNRSTARQRPPNPCSSLCRPFCWPCKSGFSLRTSIPSSSHMQLCGFANFHWPPHPPESRRKKMSSNGSLEFGHEMHKENWGGSTVPRASITDRAGTLACGRYSMQRPSFPRLILPVFDPLNPIFGPACHADNEPDTAAVPCSALIHLPRSCRLCQTLTCSRKCLPLSHLRCGAHSHGLWRRVCGCSLAHARLSSISSQKEEAYPLRMMRFGAEERRELSVVPV